MTSATKAPFKLHNTLTRAVEHFQPQNPEEVTIYTCGPTVYGDPHIGNYRTFIFEDVLVKALSRAGYQVNWVMNITDVGHLTSDADEGEDKLEVGAKREGITAWDVARKYEERFLKDIVDLRIAKPGRLIRATETIEAQIGMIKTLETKGYTYVTGDGVYFDSSKVPDYGKLARLDIQGLQAGARVDLGEKKHATDFALWKFSPSGVKRDMEWKSPWGTGFPGWHIECSAIIHESLGLTIDIHCGGVDHIPVHHTNEIAQSESATGHPLANLWAHSDFLLVDGGKMSKSLGNVYTLDDIRARGIDPLALRLLFYSASYRSKLNFTWEGLEAANRALESLRRHYHEGNAAGQVPGEALQAFNTALFNDLNMPEVMAVIWSTVRGTLSGDEKSAFLKEVDTVLSLGLAQKESLDLPLGVQELLTRRAKAREEKDWTLSDTLRHQIQEAGFVLKDTSGGIEIKKI